MAHGFALATALAAALLAVSGAGGAATQQTPKRGGTMVVALPQPEPACLNLHDERCAHDGVEPRLDKRPVPVVQDRFEARILDDVRRWIAHQT